MCIVDIQILFIHVLIQYLNLWSYELQKTIYKEYSYYEVKKDYLNIKGIPNVAFDISMAVLTSIDFLSFNLYKVNKYWQSQYK